VPTAQSLPMKRRYYPWLVKRWYAERKEMQAKLKECIKAGNKVEEEYWDKRQLVKKINLIVCMVLFLILVVASLISVLDSQLH
jgi:hypothetical protein